MKFVRPVIYGTTAKPIDNGTDHTHEWTVYFRGLNNEDISHYVKKVSFKLHESFLSPVRVVDTFPFEVTETGWGEFEIQIKVYLIDSSEPPITFTHFLRLYPAEVSSLYGGVRTIGDKVISENYDEIVFTQPSDALSQALTKHDKESQLNPSTPNYTEFCAFRDKIHKQMLEAKTQAESELAKLLKIQHDVEEELEQINDSL